MHRLLATDVGRRELLLGNEAVVRGALEAGVGLVTGYPGTPASEIGDTFAKLHHELGIHFEYSVNEKVALELAFGAALTGVRSLASMKHLGLTFAADPLSTMPYIGVVGGLVIVSAADPGCLTSPNEQDQRHLGRMLGLPTLDPATPDEARQMTAYAFDLSESCELPVLLRITTRVCHTRAPVFFAPLHPNGTRGVFKKDPTRFVPTPGNARRLREELEHRLDKACTLLAESPFNRVPVSSGSKAIVATGAPRNAVHEAVERLGQDVPVLELGALHPLPHQLVIPFLRAHREVLVVEELTPYLEDSLLAIAQHFDVPVKIRGKRDGAMPWPFELEADEVERRMRAFVLGKNGQPPVPAREKLELPSRSAVLCPGCLHRNVFFAATSVFGSATTYVNDIGCYTLGANEPHLAGDVLLAMGSSLPMASGIARTTGQRVVAFIGDSTFFHSGLPGLVNAIEARDNLVVVVLDNQVTAMTGLQPNATTSGRSQAGRIPTVVRALGVEDVAVVNAADVRATTRALQQARDGVGVSVVIAEGPCAQVAHRHDRGASLAAVPTVDHSTCHTCGMSEAGLYCQLPPSRAVEKRMAVQKEGGLSEVPRSSPCSVECPLGICIPAYVGAIAAGEPERAFQAVALRAALPSVCSHICHRPCEDLCVIADRGGTPVAINALKRYLTERAETQPSGPRAIIRTAPPTVGGKVAIVGAGPAGLAAARELAARGYAVTVYDSRERPGGMLEYAVPDYRLPREVLRRDIEAIFAQGVAFVGGRSLGESFTVEGLHREGFASVLLALGAPRSTTPPIPGMELRGVGGALSFLESPPRCDGEAVVVLGGGDVGIDVARTALKRGARQVTLAFPEAREEMTAAPDTVEEACAEGVHLRPGHVAVAIEAGDRGQAVAVALGTVSQQQRTAAGTSFEVGSGRETVLATRVVCAIGQRLEVGGLQLPGAVVGANGWLTADDYGRTSVPWLFAAGDTVSGPATVTAAMASGVRAAWGIDLALSAGQREVAPCAAPLPRVEQPARARPHRRPIQRLTAAEAQAEASRCLLCGLCRNCNTCVELLGCPAIVPGRSTPDILPELCVSCGACIDVCPNQAISATSSA